MKIQSLEFLKNRYFNLLTYIDVNNTSDDILQILERLANLLNIDKAVENELEIQSSNIVLEENRQLPRFCKKISLDLYSKYAFSYIKKFYFIPIVEEAEKQIQDAEADLEKIKGERNPILREKLENNLKSKKLYKAAVIKARNAKSLEEVQEPFRSNLIQQIEVDYEKNGGILPNYIKEYAYQDLTALAFVDAFDFYPTPASVIDKMVQLANIKDNQLILEPSAGKGDILDAIASYNNTVNLDFCEFNKYNNEILELKCYNKVGQDFLILEPQPIYDRILMNPPFEDRVDIRHIRHAFEFLKDDGILVAVITNKSISNATPETAKMRQDVELFGQIIELDEDVMTTDAERKATVSISLVVLERARYLAYVAQRESLVDIDSIKVNDFFFDTQSDLVWQVVEYSDYMLKLANRITVGIEKTYDLANIPLRSSLRPISEDKALELIESKRKEVEELKATIEAQCNNMNFESFCANGEYIALTNLITARPQFAQTPTVDYLESLNIKIQDGFKLSPTAVSGFNLATQAMETSGAFLLTDGTGAGKTIQQLLVAKYFVDKYKKPFLIVTKDERIIEQAFFGDAKKIGIDSMLRKMPKDLLYSPTKMAEYLEGEYIFVMAYVNFDLVEKPDGEANNAKELESYNEAKLNAKKSAIKWTNEEKALNKLYPNKEDKKEKTYLAAKNDIKFKRENDPALAELFQKEEEWRLWNVEKYNNIGNKLCGIAFDECHELKNWNDYDFQTGFRAKRALWISEVCKHRLFVSATPCDRAEAMLYLYQANVFPSPKFFEKFLIQAGFVKTPEKKNNMGKIVRRASLKPPGKDVGDAAIRAQLIQNIYEDMTEDGKMIKREIPLTNYNIDLINIQVPQTALDTIDRIEKYFANYEEAKKIAKEIGEDIPKREGTNVYDEILKSLEPYKISKTIELVENEIKNCRSVVVFASLVSEGEKGKQWGEIKGGTVETLYNYFSNLYGKDKVGTVIGGMKYDDVIQNVKDFQENKKIIMIATPQAGGTGISLDDQTGTRPRSLICMTAPLNAEGNVQMLGRIYRLQTKTCANAFYLFADDNYVENWLAELVANKMILLNATVGGEVEKLNIGSLKMGDVDDSLDSLESFKNTTGNQKEKEERITSHQLYKLWDTNDWIDGNDYPDKINIKIRYLADPRSRSKGKIQIKSNNKENLLTWAVAYQDILEQYGFKLDSDRYEGTMFSCNIDYSPTNANNTQFREIWGWAINCILPQFSRFISGEEKNTFNVGDDLILTQSQANGGAKGDKVRVISFRKRAITKQKVSEKEYKDIYEFLYDVVIISGNDVGNKLLRLRSCDLEFENINQLQTKLDLKTRILINIEELSNKFSEYAKYETKYNDVLVGMLEKNKYSLDTINLNCGSRKYNKFTTNYINFDKDNNVFVSGSINIYNEENMFFLNAFANFLNDEFNTNFTIYDLLKDDWKKEQYKKLYENNQNQNNESEINGINQPVTNSVLCYANYLLRNKISNARKYWFRQIDSYDKSKKTGFSFVGDWKDKKSSDTYYTNKLYLGYHNANNTNNYFLFGVTLHANNEYNNIYIIHDLQTDAYEWAALLWSNIDKFYDYVKANPNKDDYSDFKSNLNDNVTKNNLSDNIVVDTTKNNNINLDEIDSEFNFTQDNDFIFVNSKDNEIIAKINKINALITKNTKYFQNLNFTESNELLSNLINLRNLLVDKKLIVINNNLSSNIFNNITNNLSDNIDVRKSVFDTANDLYEKLKSGQFDPTDVLSNIIPILK
jgi:hypothetical protein